MAGEPRPLGSQEVPEGAGQPLGGLLREACAQLRAGGSCPLLHGLQLPWPGRAVREPGAQLLGAVPLPVWVGVGMESTELPEEP